MSRNLHTIKELRWWFRSRNSGHLNSFSYWLCVLILSVFLSVIIGALSQVWVAEQTWLHQASEYSNWIYASPPSPLKAYTEQFENKRDELINRVIYKDNALIRRNDRLISANDIKKGLNAPSGQIGGMFGKTDTPVYPSCATFSAKGQYTEEEKLIFGNFAEYVTGLYESHKGSDPTHIERDLASALGFSENKPNTATFDVPWLYVASDKGAIAVFPGTTVIADEGWDTTSRPWFRAALRGETNLTAKGLFENDVLSVTYLDVLAKSPMLVRTYMHKFKSKTQEFVIAIDLKLRHEDVSGVTPTFFNTKPDYYKIFVDALLPRKLHLGHYITFGLSVLLFLIIRWISAVRNSRLTFKRIKSLLGKIKIDDALKLQREEQITKEEKLGIDIQKYIYGKSERGQTETDALINYTNVEKTRGNLRGFELWDVFLSTSAKWRILWVRFESSKSIYVGTISLAYNNEVLPEVGWTLFNKLAFSKSEETVLCDKLPAILKHNADLFAGSFDIPYRINDFSSFLNPPEVPDWVPVVVDTKELLAIRQRRAYVKLSSEQLDELYTKSDVKAVMTSGYFEHLLNNEQIDFLLKGRTISRIISFPDHTAPLNLTDKTQVLLKDLKDRYASASSRSLKRVDIPISNESILLPVYDFVILNDSSVIVAHSISQATGIDNVTGKRTKSTYYVEGYMSWRPSDIKFYCDLFDQLAVGQLRELDSLTNKTEFV
jgi:hypothetical protein